MNRQTCQTCGSIYFPYGTQKEPEANTVELTFIFPNGKGLQKMARYEVCPNCMYAIRAYLDGAIDKNDLLFDDEGHFCRG